MIAWKEDKMEYPQSLKRLLSKYEDKQIYTCIGGMQGNAFNFDKNGISICHAAELGKRKPVEIYNFLQVENLTPENYYARIEEILDACQNENYPCRTCSYCIQKTFNFYPISGITINTTAYCQDACIYCGAHFDEKPTGYSILSIIEQFHRLELLSSHCLFDWGGGEPTSSPFYEETVKWVAEHGYNQRFNTNAVYFSQSTFDALKAGKGVLRVSPDSGTPKGYLQVKGRDHYDAVWRNISKYAVSGGEIYIKYNIFNLNSGDEELGAFIEKCALINEKNANIIVLIDAEVTAYQPRKNSGPFYFLKKEFDFAHKMLDMAQKRGLKVQISNFAFNSRPNRKDGVLCLPDEYYDNIDHEIITNGIYVKAVASDGLLYESLRESPNLPVYVLGNGDYADTAVQALQKAKISAQMIEAPCGDKDESGLSDLSKLLKEKPDAHMILASKNWKAILKQINDADYKNGGRIYYLQKERYSKD